MQFVRQSKFRHVYVKPLKREFCLEDVRITKISWDSLFCCVNTKFIAVITEGSGGPFSVFPINKVGRMDKDYPIVDAHRAPCLDIAWCPFNENVIASCSEDCTAKVWHIPDGGLVKSLKEPIVELVGHQKRVSAIIWHPTASNVLLTAAADLKIFLWNVGTGEALIEIAGHPDLIWSVDFNYNGSKIVTTCKDKKLRVIDPRTGRILQQGCGHEGVKPQRAIFLKDGRIFTTGFTKRSERMYALRDEEALEEPIVQEELDTSNGVLVPLYDVDTGLLYLVGKGDSNVRYYEINNDPPFVHFINVYTSPEPQRGIGFMPKRGLNINENEIARMYKVTNKGLVDVLQFFVPRKSELFQEDLYPDTAAGVPAISADEWMNGKDADPTLVALKGARSSTGDSKTQSTVKKSNILAQIQPSSSAEPPAPTTVKRSLQVSPSQSGAETDARQQPSPTDGGSVTTVIMRKPNPSREPRSAAVSVSEPKIDDSGIVDLRSKSNAALRHAEQQRQQQQAEESARNRDQRDALPPRSGGDFHSLREAFERDVPPAGSASGRGGAAAGNAPAGSGVKGHSWQTSSSRDSLFSSREPTPKQQQREFADSSGNVGGSNGLFRSNSGAECNVDDLMAELQKLKTVLRRHERRIRHLEEHLQERDMLDFENL